MQWPTDPNICQFTINVRRRLAELGMTQKALSTKMGKNAVWLSRRLTGDYNISHTDAALIACTLGTTTAALYGGPQREVEGSTS